MTKYTSTFIVPLYLPCSGAACRSARCWTSRTAGWWRTSPSRRNCTSGPTARATPPSDLSSPYIAHRPRRYLHSLFLTPIDTSSVAFCYLLAIPGCNVVLSFTIITTAQRLNLLVFLCRWRSTPTRPIITRTCSPSRRSRRSASSPTCVSTRTKLKKCVPVIPTTFYHYTSIGTTTVQTNKIISLEIEFSSMT